MPVFALSLSSKQILQISLGSQEVDFALKLKLQNPGIADLNEGLRKTPPIYRAPPHWQMLVRRSVIIVNVDESQTLRQAKHCSAQRNASHVGVTHVKGNS